MYLSDAVGKLGRYYSASSELVCAARHWACRLFKSIETAVSDPRPYLFVKVTWESTRRDTAACRIAFGLFARALTLLLHRPISLRARFAYLSPGAVRSTAYHKHSTTHLDGKLEILLFSSCYYPYALSPPSSSIKTLQSVSFGLQPNLASLSALVLSPQPHMIGPNG